MKQIVKTIVLYLMSTVNKFYPKAEKNIVFLSYPDMTDNSFSLFKYMIENNQKKFKFTWLLQEPEHLDLYKKMIGNNVNISKADIENIQFIKKSSIHGFLAYCSAKYIFFTHGFFIGMSVPKNQTLVNLWHGMPLKTIAYLDQDKEKNSVAKSTFTAIPPC